MKRILVQHKRCLSCKACEAACAVEHHPARSLLAALGDRKTQIGVRVFALGHASLPIACRHCDPADCLDACPSDAMRRDARTGAVIIDPAVCGGCAMCATVCPFDAISFKVTHASPDGREVAYKCDLCSDRLKAGKQPACVEACHSNAMVFSEIDGFREEGAQKSLRTYLVDGDGMPPLMELFRDLRRKEAARGQSVPLRVSWR